MKTKRALLVLFFILACFSTQAADTVPAPYVVGIRSAVTSDEGRTFDPTTIRHLTQDQVNEEAEKAPCLADVVATLEESLNSNSLQIKAILGFARHRAPGSRYVRVDLLHAERPGFYGSNAGTGISEGFKDSYNIISFSIVDKSGNRTLPNEWALRSTTEWQSIHSGAMETVRCPIYSFGIKEKLNEITREMGGGISAPDWE